MHAPSASRAADQHEEDNKYRFFQGSCSKTNAEFTGREAVGSAWNDKLVTTMVIKIYLSCRVVYVEDRNCHHAPEAVDNYIC